MSVTSYTEQTFKAYLFAQVAPALAAIIGWASANDAAFQTMVDDTLLVLDVTDITTLVTLDELARLRAVGKYMLWRSAIQFLVTQYDVTVDGSSFKRSQLIQNLQQLMLFAYDEAIAAGVDPSDLPPAPGSVAMPDVTITAVGRSDPYNAPSSLYGIDRE